MKLTRETVEHVAELAGLELSEREKETFRKQLGEVLRYMEMLNDIDTASVRPTLHVIGLKNVMRNDLPGAALPLGEALRNAPHSDGNLFVVPKVVDSEA